MTCNLFGNYLTKKFTDIWDSADKFIQEYSTSKLVSISNDDATTLYYLLYARYGNSSIANADENQFKYKVFSTIFMYGPTWVKRLDIQEKLRGLTEDEILLGTKQILNHSLNPSTKPSTKDLEELPTIDSQNTAHYKKGKLDAYSDLMALLETDVTAYFLDRFKPLFLTIVEPQEPLWYITETEGGE